MEEHNRILAKNLSCMLSELNMSQNELARRLGKSKATVSSWTRGEKAPTMRSIDEMCNVFGCERSDLLGDIEFTYREEKKILIEVASKLNKEGLERLIAYAKDMEKIYGV